MLAVAADPDLNTHSCARLRAAFRTHGYHTDGVLEVLGAAANEALGRGEPEPARRACAGAGPRGTLIRLFLLGDAVPAGELSAALHPLPLGEALAGGLITGGADRLRAALDVRPYQDGWIVSDLGADRQDAPPPAWQVPGVSPDARTLARATVRRHVDTLLDLGTGCGVQALHAGAHAGRITATDAAPRALALAAMTARLCQLDVEFAEGAWFTPVARRRFDQVVCHPPLAVRPPGVDYAHRDSGLPGDEVSAMLVRQLPSVLNPGGVGQLLGAWLHRSGEPWAERVGSWLPPGGLDAWFVQHDVVEPVRYVGEQLRAAGIDPGSAEGRRASGEWLDWFTANDVEGIGFGVVTLRRTDAADSTLNCEDLPAGLRGEQVAGWLDRTAWLRAHPGDQDLLGARLTVPDGVTLERTELPGDEGWQTATSVLRHPDGPGWWHELDDLSRALVAGCRGLLPLEDLIGLLAAAHELPAGELAGAALPAVRELIRHGMLLPEGVA